MKLGVIADIHGDPVGLELAWAHLMVMGAERIICAGDLVGRGPFPERVIAFAKEYEIPTVRGNHDRATGLDPLGAPDPFGGGPVSPESRRWLAGLPRDLVMECPPRRVLVMVHAGLADDLEFVTPKTHPAPVLEGFLAQVGADILVFGHTHEPGWHRSPKGLVLNPGSVVSLPGVRSSRTFAMLDTDLLSATFHDVETGEPVDVPPWGEAGGGPSAKLRHRRGPI